MSKSMTKASRIASVVVLIGIRLVTLGPIEFRPDTGHAGLDRAVAFFLLGATLGIGFPKRFPLSLFFIVGVAVALEVLQLVAPGRHARFDDMLVKAVAGALGVFLPWILMWGYRRSTTD